MRAPFLAISHALLAACFSPLLAQSPPAYVVESTTTDDLYSVDLSTGAATLIGSASNNGLSSPADLAWRYDTHEMWTIDLSGGELGVIDLATAVFTPRVQTSLSGWQGLAWDPRSQLFYASNQTGGTTYTIDPATGTVTALGASGFGHLSSMKVDATGTLWGVVFGSGAIVTVDKTTGAATQVATTLANFGDVSVDHDGVFYGSNSSDDSLHQIDMTTGMATLIGPHGAGITFVKGFEIAEGGIMRTGDGCLDGTGTPVRMLFSGNPVVGQPPFSLGISAGATLPAAVLFGFDNERLGAVLLPLDLAAIGAPGCMLYTSSDVSSALLQTGTRLPMSVPNQLGLVGAVLFAQGVVLDGSANQLGVAMSDYVRIVVQM